MAKSTIEFKIKWKWYANPVIFLCRMFNYYGAVKHLYTVEIIK